MSGAIVKEIDAIGVAWKVRLLFRCCVTAYARGTGLSISQPLAVTTDCANAVGVEF